MYYLLPYKTYILYIGYMYEFFHTDHCTEILCVRGVRTITMIGN